ncbi:MAG: polysaccharide deacetylase family protein [Chlorobia bacterium]|nr:polysaccharide deacetylase family protein [Fimbriimonadaceae bacterium]
MRLMKLATLCYHKVGTEAKEGRRLNIHPDRLDSHVRFFKRRNYRFVKGSDLVQWPEEKTVCFTFDDGFVSTIDNGVPVLERHQVPMSVYVVSGFVGKASEWEGELARPLAGWDSLRKIQELGHEVGNHTVSHLRLGDLDGSEQRKQIRECHEAMLAEGLHPVSFCYPYGSLNAESDQVLQSSDYQVGLALGKRLPQTSDSQLAIPRIVIAYGDALPLLIYRLWIRPKLLSSK